MRNLLITATLTMLLTACHSPTQAFYQPAPPASTSTSVAASASASEAAPTSTEDWTLVKTTSGIDGDTLKAFKIFLFPDRNSTAFNVEVSCTQGKTPSMVVESFVGAEQNNPDKRSAFAYQSSSSNGLLGGFQPTGRMKIGSGAPETLALTFHVDPSYSNRIIMDSNRFAPIEGLWDSALRFPMVLELTNGVGVFELDIPASPEINQVLAACAGALKAETASQEQPAPQPPAPTAQQDAATASSPVRNTGAIRDTFSKKYDEPAEDTTVAQPYNQETR